MSSEFERTQKIKNELESIKFSREIFVNVIKRVLKTNLSTNINTLKQYRIDTVNAFNTFSQTLRHIFTVAEVASQKLIGENFEYAREKLNEVFARLQITSSVPIPSIVGEHINIDNISEIAEEPSNFESHSSESSPNSDSNQSIFLEPLELEQIAMATPPTTAEFLKLASSTLNYKYAGDPLALAAFIDSVRLLQTLATTDALRTFLVSFTKTKLDGRAREYINDTHTTIEHILSALRDNIKPDNSKVVEGRMLALRLTYNTQDDFSKKVEELSDSLRRSLIIEGMSAQKATEISVEKAIDLCRSQTKSEIVKAVLESATFASPKDVVAKLLTQSEKAKKEHQILSISSSRNQPGNRGRSSANNNSNNANNQRRGNNRHYGQNRIDSRINNQNGSFNPPHRNGNFGSNRGRGRGNYHNNNRGFNQNFNGNFNRQPHNNNNFHNNNAQYVGYTSADTPGNPGVPQQFLLGANDH